MIQYSEPDRVERPMTDLDVVDRIGADLRAAGYTADDVPELLGAGAHRALSRGELWPALRVTRDGSPLSTLVRLFLLGTTEPESLVRRALPTTGITAASGVGALELDGSDVRAGLDIRPHADEDDDYLVVSDLDSDTRPGPVRHDHVLGIGQASLTLARAVIREPVGSVLDIGTGCGIQALHAFSHSRSIVATDTNPRALALAGATARLNGQHWDLRAGSLFEPVAGEQFDLIISNPPFVIGTGTQQYIYAIPELPATACASRWFVTCRRSWRRAELVSCWPTGSSAVRPTGASESVAGSRRPVVMPGWCSAS